MPTTNLFWFSAAVVIANLVAAAMVYKNNPRSATNRIFVFLSVVTAAWVIVMHLSSGGSSLLLARLTVFLAVPQTALFFLLARTIPDAVFSMSRARHAALWTAATVVMALTISPHPILSVFQQSGSEIVPGPGMVLFAAYVLFASGGACIVLLRKVDAAKGVLKQQLRFVAWGMALLLGLITGTVLMPVVLLENSTFVRLAPLYVLLFLGMTAYAIIRHRLFDIRPILARALSFTALVALVAGVYTLALFAWAQSAFAAPVPFPVLVAGWILTVLAVLTFPALRGTIERTTNRIFFRETYRTDELLASLTRTMAETLDLDTMMHGILALLSGRMGIAKAAFLLVDEHRISMVKAVGYTDTALVRQELEGLFHQYLQTTPYVLFEDMPESPLKELFRQLDVEFVVPIRVESAEIAILTLGPKSSGEVYAARELEMLTIFASEAGIAIQNAKSYDAVKRLSKELEMRVEERTRELKESQARELEKARDVARLKDEFVFVAAHELRTPVTVIRGFMEIVSDAGARLSPDLKNSLHAISAASDQLNQLINDLLEIARSNAGATKIAVQPVDIPDLITRITGQLMPVAEKRKVRLTVVPQGAVPLAGADEKKLTEVLNNLIGNAIKYNKEGGSVDVTIFEQSAGIARHVIVEIRDTGYGIPKEQQDKIFGKFFRAVTPGTEEVLGTGLGLFITRMLIERMGGRIRFSSVEGEGTTFVFSLPVASPATETSSLPAAVPAA